jgi:nitrite reductase/ring-hydroxylating ferredoxin subunit
MATDRATPLMPVAAGRIQAPPVDRFPKYPVSWYLFCTANEIRRGPVSKNFLGRRLVAYRTSAGQVVVMDARCSHLGADLGQGRVIGEAIQCPFHHWEYGPDGHCRRIPAQADIPAFARQRCYPAVERHGLVFIFNGRQPLFPLPFFPECRPDDLVPAKPFGTELDCPWYLVSANAHDLQHFRAAHDRRLQGNPVADTPHPYARRASGTFTIVGRSLRDRLTRRFAGDAVTLSFVDWCGTLGFTTATFHRTVSYGLVSVVPTESGGTQVAVIVFIRRANNRLARVLFDPIQLAVRRYFIMKFLAEDAALLDGVRYNPGGLIECDRHMAEYFDWLGKVTHGQPRSTADAADGGEFVAGQHDSQFVSAIRCHSPCSEEHKP